MKRLAVFAVAAVVSGGAAFAGDLPVGPSTPQVPAPIIQHGLPTNQPLGTAPRSFSIASMFKKTSADVPTVQPPPPTAPVPPLPTAMIAPVVVAPAACASPAACSVADRGSCCDRLKRWLCFKPTAIHVPITPTPCYAPNYEFFACKSNGGPAGGCAPTGHGLFARTPKEKCAPSCDPRTGPVDAGLPGFRFAAPESPAVAGGAQAAPGPVVNTAFKMPSYGTKPPAK
jgi:hypothetical protein